MGPGCSVSNRHNLPLKRPLFRLFSQPGPDRILEHVIPLFGIAFPVSQNVVEKPGLPVRKRIVDSARQRSFQQPDGGADPVLRGEPYETVDVVRHDDIAPKRNATNFCLRCERQEFPVHLLVVQDLLPGKCAEGNEINRRVVGLKNAFETVWFPWLLFHAGSVEEKRVPVKTLYLKDRCANGQRFVRVTVPFQRLEVEGM